MKDYPQALRGADLARHALGGHMALEEYETGLGVAVAQLRAFAHRYGLAWPYVHGLDCDMDEDCTCPHDTRAEDFARPYFEDPNDHIERDQLPTDFYA